jgi:DNA-binding response OmpR family regulator
MNKSAIVIEDDEGIREYVKEILFEQGFSVRDTARGLKGQELVEKTQPDLVILDLKLPDIEGEEVCRNIKKNVPETVVIILTAKDATKDIVQGFNYGADDYITKPFTSEVLLARIRARLKSDVGTRDKPLKIADLILNPKSMDVERGRKKIHLTPQEYKLLEYLMTNKDRVLTREMILNKIWRYSPDVESRVVDVYIGYLRKKIDKGHKINLIHSARGFGYIIKEEQDSD